MYVTRISMPVGTIIINPCDIIFNLLSDLSDWHKFIWGGGFATSINNFKTAAPGEESVYTILATSLGDLREVAFERY